jgi:REP element-mobilizing transposase RayT
MDKQGRQPRIHIPNTIHHVMMRGNNRQIIFRHDIYHARILELLHDASKKFDHKILAFCLMSNHVHLLIHINTSSLSLVMKNINYRYARWMNRKENRIGHLFQGRYRSLEVSNDIYFVNLCRYIHHNPIEAKMVNNLDEYRWSSHQNYMENNFPSWMDSELMLSVIKNITNLSYIDFIVRQAKLGTSCG